MGRGPRLIVQRTRTAARGFALVYAARAQTQEANLVKRTARSSAVDQHRSTGRPGQGPRLSFLPPRGRSCFQFGSTAGAGGLRVGKVPFYDPTTPAEGRAERGPYQG